MRALLASLLLLAGCAGAAEDEAGSQDSGPAAPPSAGAAAATTAPSEHASGRVECAAPEETIFSCAMSGGKRLAVCAPQAGAAQYRFGGTSPELVLTGGKWATAMYSGGGEAQIEFANGDTVYTVFSRMIRTNFAAGEPNYPAITDGVVITRDGKFVALRLCEGGQADMPVQYDAAERAFPQSEDLFTDETIRADPDWANE
ncbi:hypothetical protein [Qipengyuania sp.]|uniref:hypothetical protein n=1 Tax=Qipengyuania sp. TaxID=2004515 RepID=UPI003AF76388